MMIYVLPNDPFLQNFSSYPHFGPFPVSGKIADILLAL